MSTSTKIGNILITTSKSLELYEPNGNTEDVKIGILHSVSGYYVSNEGTKLNPNFHVWIPTITHATCDSAYSEISLAVCRCNYLERNKVEAKYQKS